MDYGDFKVGDVVQLNSGGPRMTVQHVATPEEYPIEFGIWCVWFEGNKKNGASFPPPTLTKLDSDNV